MQKSGYVMCLIDCNYFFFLLSALLVKSARSIEGKLDKNC